MYGKAHPSLSGVYLSINASLERQALQTISEIASVATQQKQASGNLQQPVVNNQWLC